MITTKTCIKCKKTLPVSSFYKHSRGYFRGDCIACTAIQNKEYNLKNKEKVAAIGKEWAARNKEKIKETKIRRKFGIGLKEKGEIFEAQGNACAICKCTENGRARDWDVDHCHTTGKVRGILCSNCNRALGLFQDNKQNLLRAAVYLGESGQ